MFGTKGAEPSQRQGRLHKKGRREEADFDSFSSGKAKRRAVQARLLAGRTDSFWQRSPRQGSGSG